jgi:hypothetical protein
MASNIVSETIDAAYPVAGVDNDTQGFRDNFQIIKDGLLTAKSEITSLQDQTAKVTDENNGVVENNFRESSILNASLDNVTSKLKPNQTWNEQTQVNVDIGRGHYQVYTLGPEITEAITFSLESWPIRNTNDGVARVSLHIYGNDNPITVRLVSANNGAIYKTSDWPLPVGDSSSDDSAPVVVNSSTQPVIIDLWSYDSGTTVYANYLGQFAKSSDA